MNKKVIKNTQLKFNQDFPGLWAVNIMAQQFPIEPFLVFTEFRMDRPVFGPHPHAGISVMTYILPDSPQGFINRDSNGDHSDIEPGGLHITQAGSGIHHDEFPKVPGTPAKGFQIWINHSEENRWAPPKAMHAKAAEIPEIETDGYKVRVLHGSFAGKAPAYAMLTDVTLLHVALQAGQSLVLPAGEMAFVYGLAGSGSTDGQAVSAQGLVNFDAAGEKVQVQATSEGFSFMFGAGRPLREPIVYGGPFVMTTPQQMAATRKRYADGLMGVLSPHKS
jgi:hypothetical protein